LTTSTLYFGILLFHNIYYLYNERVHWLTQHDHLITAYPAPAASYS